MLMFIVSAAKELKFEERRELCKRETLDSFFETGKRKIKKKKGNVSKKLDELIR